MAIAKIELEKLLKENFPQAKIEVIDLAGDDNHYSVKIIDEKGIVMAQEFYKNNMPIGTHFKNFPDGKTKYVCVFDKKGIKIEEFSFDEYGVKKVIIKKPEKNKKN